MLASGRGALKAVPALSSATIGGKQCPRRNRLTLESIPDSTILFGMTMLEAGRQGRGQRVLALGALVGVLNAGRSANGYRRYPAKAFARVQLVRRALAVGFTLDELGTVLKVRDRGGVPCRRVRELAAEKLLAVESRLSELSALRDELRSSLKDWDRRLAQTDPAAPAGLLEALASSRNNHVNRSLRPALSGRNPKRTGVKL